MIKNISILAVTATITLLLAACSETTRTTAWYVENGREQAVEFEECKHKPELKETPNCIAANEANLIIMEGSEAIKKYLASQK
jgi:PBP1b-binding outer membrane lipoprotein LpoB